MKPQVVPVDELIAALRALLTPQHDDEEWADKMEAARALLAQIDQEAGR